MSRPTKSGAGDFPHRITIMRDVGATQDAMGQPEHDWQPYIKLWAGEEMTSGRELFNAQQVQPDVSSVITTRYDKRVKPSLRLVPKANSGRTLEIVAALNKGNFNVEMELWCKEPI